MYKKNIYDSILLKVGEAFLIRREKRLCEEGEESKIVSSEISAKRDQKQLILDDVRISGLYKLIQEYKGSSGTATSNAGNANKSNDAQMSDPNSDTKENDDNKTKESGNGSSKKDKGEDNDQTAGGKRSDPEHKKILMA